MSNRGLGDRPTERNQQTAQTTAAIARTARGRRVKAQQTKKEKEAEAKKK